MDAIDRAIVQLLQTNGRLSQEQIARQVSLSRPAVHERLKRLEEQRVIRGYQARVDWQAMGLPLTAFIWIRTDLTPVAAVATQILQTAETTARVEECHRITGDWCLLLKVRSESTLSLQDFLDRLRTVTGVLGTMTTVVLSSLRE
ncbi:MAG: Lrp/AsnC family transcriptional regulator [Oculatellaceae cyanobacterium Prado106]|nr:Lrp/AsnC family transcriptional regulator [Oculatellaceae cyanobacterium Prado106]